MTCQRCGLEVCCCDTFPRRASGPGLPIDPTSRLAAELLQGLLAREGRRLAGAEVLLGLVSPGPARMHGCSFASPTLGEPALTLSMVRSCIVAIKAMLEMHPELASSILWLCEQHLEKSLAATLISPEAKQLGAQVQLVHLLAAETGSPHLLMTHDRPRQQFRHVHTFGAEDRQRLYTGLRTIAERIRAER